jgi:hypothetical protein
MCTVSHRLSAICTVYTIPCTEVGVNTLSCFKNIKTVDECHISFSKHGCKHLEELCENTISSTCNSPSKGYRKLLSSIFNRQKKKEVSSYALTSPQDSLPKYVTHFD